MNRYYCPFCSSTYQFNSMSSDGTLICGLCGDQLVKKPFLNSKRIIASLAAFAFLAPLILMIIYTVKDFTNEKRLNNPESIVLRLSVNNE